MRIHEYGDASVIREDETPRPVPGPGEVLVRVAATSFNPSDVGLRRGLLRDALPHELPFTLGADLAGTVVDSAVDTLTAGNRVVGRVDRGGAAAEYAVVAAGTLAAAPTTIPLAHAAAIPVAGITAWQAVFEHAGIRGGERVLVNGAGGGVGGFAVQLAKLAGAYVIGTASPRSACAVRQLGADEVVDYTVSPLPRDVDVLLHLVPGKPLPVRRVVSVTGGFVARNDAGQLAELVGLIDAGAVRVDVAGCRAMSELAAVHRDAEAGLLRGKTVLTNA